MFKSAPRNILIINIWYILYIWLWYTKTIRSCQSLYQFLRTSTSETLKLCFCVQSCIITSQAFLFIAEWLKNCFDFQNGWKTASRWARGFQGSVWHVWQQSCKMSPIWQIYLCTNIEGWGKNCRRPRSFVKLSSCWDG